METLTLTLTARQRMRLALDLAGKTAQDAAEALGVSPNTIANWLAGRSRPRPSDRRELARLLEQPLDFFDDPWMVFHDRRATAGPTDEIGGWQGATLTVGGAMILYMVFGWRRFWYGPAVARKRQASTST